MPENDLKITKGTTKTYTYYGESGTSLLSASLQVSGHPNAQPNMADGFDSQLTGKPVNCNYCPNCTTHVYHHQTVMGDKIVVRTVLLDGGKDFKPAAEIFGKAKMSWEPEVAKTFDTLPPS